MSHMKRFLEDVAEEMDLPVDDQDVLEIAEERLQSGDLPQATLDRIAERERRENRELIRCWQSEDANKRVAILFIHRDKPEDCPIFSGDTDGEVAGQVLAWMVDSGLACDRVEVAVH